MFKFIVFKKMFIYSACFMFFGLLFVFFVINYSAPVQNLINNTVKNWTEFDNDNTYKLKFVFNNFDKTANEDSFAKLKFVAPLEGSIKELKENKIEYTRQSSGRIIMPINGKIADIYRSGKEKCVKIQVSENIYVVLSGKLTVGVSVGDDITAGTFIGMLDSYSLSLQVFKNGNVLNASEIGEAL